MDLDDNHWRENHYPNHAYYAAVVKLPEFPQKWRDEYLMDLAMCTLKDSLPDARLTHDEGKCTGFFWTETVWSERLEAICLSWHGVNGLWHRCYEIIEGRTVAPLPKKTRRRKNL